MPLSPGRRGPCIYIFLLEPEDNSRSQAAFGDHPQDVSMEDDMNDANKMQEDADIANEGKVVDGLGGKLDMICPAFIAFTFFARTQGQHCSRWYILIYFYTGMLIYIRLQTP